MSANNQSINTEKPEQIIDDMLASLDDTHAALVGAARQVGYQRAALQAIRPYWAAMGNASTHHPGYAQVYASGINMLAAVRGELHSQQGAVTPWTQQFNYTSGSMPSLVNTTHTTQAFISVMAAPTNFDLFTGPDRHEDYARRLTQWEPALGKTYQEIWEALYATRAAPERAALYLIRQAFDHFFEKLAPDAAVRVSPYWQGKTEPGKEDQVWRQERIEYAARTHVADSVRANTLIASTRHMIDVYRALNRAHVPREINRDNGRVALAEMQSILEDWANAIGI